MLRLLPEEVDILLKALKLKLLEPSEAEILKAFMLRLECIRDAQEKKQYKSTFTVPIISK